MQHSDDACLAYTLSAICNLLSEVGISNTTGIIGSSFSPVANMRISLSIQQQLFVLLRRSLKRAESLKLKRLLASNHLAMAKFELRVTTHLTVDCILYWDWVWIFMLCFKLRFLTWWHGYLLRIKNITKLWERENIFFGLSSNW